jgi:hypothetical protein
MSKLSKDPRRKEVWMRDKPKFAELLQRLRGRLKEKGTKTGKEGDSEHPPPKKKEASRRQSRGTNCYLIPTPAPILVQVRKKFKLSDELVMGIVQLALEQADWRCK